MHKFAVVVAAITALLTGCSGSGYDEDYTTEEQDDPSATVPGFDYGDGLTEDYEYCKEVGNSYEAQGSGSNEDGYNACLDALDAVSGYGG